MKLRIHLLLVAIVAVTTGLIFLDEPKFGDDFTYWYHAFKLHEIGMKAWSIDSFHQIRWPVWGVCWVLQGIFGPGLISYYGTPYLYLALGAILAFLAGRKVFQKMGAAWACALAFLFHPLLDILLSRPMPDVGEGIFGAFAVFAWYAMMNAETRSRIVWSGIGAGVAIFLGEENRFTGVFLIPLLGCLTLLFHRRQWLRLLIPFGVFALLLGGQMAFYKWRFNDWFHFITVNAGAKGRHGTEAVPIWTLPFRFLDTLSKGCPLAPVYATFGALGLWFGWRRGGFARVVVAWFALMYLAYACAPQKLWPYQPMLRDADRFLASLAIPYGVLAVIGLRGVIDAAASSERFRKWSPASWLEKHAALTGVLTFVALLPISGDPLGDRDFFTLSYVHEFKAHMRALPAGTTVFTHEQMRALAHMVDAESASRIHWLADEKWILKRTPALEAAAASADEFWYVRKLALLRDFKDITSGKVSEQPPLASYFEHPEEKWKLACVLAKDDTPDVVLYRRRKPDEKPLILEASSPVLKGLLPALPIDWKKGSTKDSVDLDWPIPAELRGKLIRIEMNASSEHREAFSVQVAFASGKNAQPPYNLKPYFFSKGGLEFVALAVPADADSCHIRVHFEKAAKSAHISDVRIVAD